MTGKTGKRKLTDRYFINLHDKFVKDMLAEEEVEEEEQGKVEEREAKVDKE